MFHEGFKGKKRLTFTGFFRILEHEYYMRRCFQLASLGAGSVSPNPLVGAVLVYRGKIIAEGYHKKFGGPHAEAEALRLVNDPDVLRESTLYVNLEPCSHTGKTPPCTNLIIEKKVGKVVVSISDPFHLVNGKGIHKLKNAGIQVVENVLAEEGSWLNRRFITYQRLQRPYIILKWAESTDGFIAPLKQEQGKIHWISNTSSRLMVHYQRSREKAILVGKKTVESDNPRLNVRGITGNDPIRVVVDPGLLLHTGFQIFNEDVKTYVINKVKSGIEKQITYVKITNMNNMVDELIQILYAKQIQSVLVEGGAFTISQFIDSGKWDEALVFRGSGLLSEGLTAPVTGTPVIASYSIGSDRLSVFLNNAVA